jgi:hypothetical protein
MTGLFPREKWPLGQVNVEFHVTELFIHHSDAPMEPFPQVSER